MYQFIDRLHMLYSLLQDELSKEIFQAMFALDMEQSIPNIKRLSSLAGFEDSEFMRWLQPLKGELKKLNRENKKIILYGTANMGKLLARVLQYEHIDFYGFCGRHAEKFPDGLFGKPVLSPDELRSTGGYYVVIAVSEDAYLEILKELREHDYPEDHILDWVDVIGGKLDDENDDMIEELGKLNERHYFEFPELYHRNTAFLDCGCYDCANSYKFAQWCSGMYSSIVAFEPDPGNYARCCEKLRDVPLANIQLVNAGLSDREGTAVFNAKNSASSHVIPVELPSEFSISRTKTENEIEIRTVAIDDIVGDRTVGFIKMDIEGAEFDALHGAKNTIIRDKPFLAISVYHLQGDVFAIMDYLHQILPEYRFYLRHYSSFMGETVLYASVDL